MQLGAEPQLHKALSALDYVRGEPLETPREERYSEFLESLQLLGRGFVFKEIVRPFYADVRGRFREPPRRLWTRIVPTLAVANDLRRRVCLDPVGDVRLRGLRVAAAYRPKGGARRSQHKSNAALDLDLLPGDLRHTRWFYEQAVRLWCEYGAELQMGLGLYCSSRARGGMRVHIDTGFKARTWQISGGRSLRPFVHLGRPVPLAVDLAAELNLVPPL